MEKQRKNEENYSEIFVGGCHPKSTKSKRVGNRRGDAQILPAVR